MRGLARCSRRSIVAAVALLVLVLGAFAGVVVRAQHQSQSGLEDRFRLRSALAARFVEAFIADVEREERALARGWLAGATVRQRQFESVVRRFGFRAALVLDHRGRVLAVYPRERRLVGREIASRYAHLRAALRGRSQVSDVVPSAARREPVVAVAVPFQTRHGRRVFSGAFSADGTALAAYLRTAVPLTLGAAELLDANGRVIAAAGAKLRSDESVFVAPTAVPRTGWRVELAAPKDQLFAPVSGLAKWVPWLLFGGFGVTAFAILLLFLRLLESRTALAERNMEVTRLMRTQQRFVASTSHELRTPLTSVIGYLEVLRKGMAGEVSEQQRNLLDVIHRNANRLLDLIADLMLAAQLDAGRLQLEREPVSVADVARETAESALPAANDKRIELVVEAGDVPPVLADRKRVAQVVENLVSNALKFTPERGRVEVRSYPQNGSVVVEVRDSGIGIPEEDQARVFQRFFRASTAVEEEVPGTGLGLAIARNLAELHGGRLRFTSAKGAGSTFFLELPLSR